MNFEGTVSVAFCANKPSNFQSFWMIKHAEYEMRFSLDKNVIRYLSKRFSLQYEYDFLITLLQRCNVWRVEISYTGHVLAINRLKIWFPEHSILE